MTNNELRSEIDELHNAQFSPSEIRDYLNHHNNAGIDYAYVAFIINDN